MVLICIGEEHTHHYVQDTPTKHNLDPAMLHTHTHTHTHPLDSAILLKLSPQLALRCIIVLEESSKVNNITLKSNITHNSPNKQSLKWITIHVGVTLQVPWEGHTH